jgi:hypothetical protein
MNFVDTESEGQRTRKSSFELVPSGRFSFIIQEELPNSIEERSPYFIENFKFEYNQNKKNVALEIKEGNEELTNNSSSDSHLKEKDRHQFFLVQKRTRLIEEPVIKLSRFEKYTFSFTKRENLDKKIIRGFRKYLNMKKRQLTAIINNSGCSDFWNHFISCNLFPPFEYYDFSLDQKVNFKSFNYAYIMWIFSHNMGSDLFQIFNKENIRTLISYYILNFEIKENERDLLKEYIENFHTIFSTEINESDKF